MDLTELHEGGLLYMNGDYSEDVEHEKNLKLSKSFPVFRTQFSMQQPSPQRTSLSLKGRIYLI